MNPLEFATYVRYKTRTNSVTFPDTDILALMKIRQDELARDILAVGEDILLIPQTTDLILNQREYAFPHDILASVKRVEAKFNGTDWVKLENVDLSTIDFPITESNITAHYSNLEGHCFYDLSRNSIYILSGSITAVTAGLKAWFNTWPTAITDLNDDTDLSADPSTTTLGIPRSLHEIWARGVIIDYKESREQPITLTQMEQMYELHKKQAIASLKPQDLSVQTIGSIPEPSTTGNFGYNY